MSEDIRVRVARLVREHCAKLTDTTMSTKELGDRLTLTIPLPDFGQAPGALLNHMARRELCDCATQGEPEPGPYGKNIRRWRWHAPIAGRVPSDKPKASAPRPVDIGADLAEIKMMLNKLLTNGQ